MNTDNTRVPQAPGQAVRQLLPEWYPQEAVILTWPDSHTDWHPWLEAVRTTYLTIIAALNHNRTPVILLVRAAAMAACQARLSAPDWATKIDAVLLVAAEYNDTWVRDYGFLSCAQLATDEQHRPATDKEQRPATNKQQRPAAAIQSVNFVFNGWGEKFNAELDNQINTQVFASLLARPVLDVEFVLEGGAVEIDETGHLLTTRLCLANPLRNGAFNRAYNYQQLQQALGPTRITILDHGHLQGDDTDGHIDTLVRFAPAQTLVVQSCANRRSDSHYHSLAALVAECRTALPEHTIVELPLAEIYADAGERLPASYANYLISNNQVLCPVYGEPEDAIALRQIANAYPSMQITAINCRPLLQQFGSLHCISMQVPTGALKPHIVHQANSGVTIYVEN